MVAISSVMTSPGKRMPVDMVESFQPDKGHRAGAGMARQRRLKVETSLGEMAED